MMSIWGPHDSPYADQFGYYHPDGKTQTGQLKYKKMVQDLNQTREDILAIANVEARIKALDQFYGVRVLEANGLPDVWRAGLVDSAPQTLQAAYNTALNYEKARINMTGDSYVYPKVRYVYCNPDQKPREKVNIPDFVQPMNTVYNNLEDVADTGAKRVNFHDATHRRDV
ncbi:hypothetical protein TSAR_001809 [Trichomalopsis sarcophagae]|uniref:Uncharacterized protein n=1 Tax=Trichomalopsis sarcophagae TaxID=543379 RepID=A0A232EJY8_9HYME|nr:hypothetical protein TSAR_001809 [Trichomalopsis sarcophagae]